MTSGTFHLAALSDIIVNRDERQRRDLSDIDTLADSIRRLGLIHPVVVTRQMELVAGERRYAACTRLGWSNIPVQFTDELSPDRLQAIELEENIKRQDISWQDHAMAVYKYHALRQREAAAEGKEWFRGDTAEAIGMTAMHVGSLVDVATELLGNNERVKEAPTVSTAIGVVRRAKEREEQRILDKLHEGLPGISLKEEPPPESIITADFTEWVLGQVNTRFNFIHCDFPYGIGADSFNQGSAKSHGGYEDTQETWEKLMFALDLATKTIMSRSSHLMFWFAMRKGDERLYEPTARRLEAIGWDINPMPLIWVKSDAGIIPDPERGPRQVYETCFLGSRGDRKIVRAVANAYQAPIVRDRHMSEKSEPMLRHFFQMLVDENTVMLDPTCGSGSALRAAESLGAKYALGLEINPEFTQLAREALERARRLRRAEASSHI